MQGKRPAANDSMEGNLLDLCADARREDLFQCVDVAAFDGGPASVFRAI